MQPVQLCVHSDYSLLESCARVQDIVQRAKEFGYTAIGLTDHNTTAGHVEFEQACRTHGVKPVFGLELDIAYPREFRLDDRNLQTTVTLLAKNALGYKNLLLLASAPKPVDLDYLKTHKAGLILLSGGSGGQLNALVVAGELDKATELHNSFRAVFGEDYFIQLEMDNENESRVSNLLTKTFPGAKFCAAQSVRYLFEPDRRLLQALRALGQRISIDECVVSEKPMLAPDQFMELFANVHQAVENSHLIADQCSVTLPRHEGFPELPEHLDLDSLVWLGAKTRYGEIDGDIQERISYELGVIREMGFQNYFLIVADIVKFAKQEGIPVGPGRGSAASSAVAYCLGITEVDPVAYGLVFERFLNKERRNLPDIDLDFCFARREEVINYVAQRFGREHVALIGTYGTFGERSAVQQIRRVLGLEDNQSSPALTQLSNRIKGIKRNFSTHAAGMVITSQPVTEYSAVHLERNVPVTHLDMDSLQRQGLLKIDLLGLRTLTLLAETEREVRKVEPGFSLSNIPFDDKPTLELLGKGQTAGVFQLESDLFRELLQSFKPDSFLDVAVLLALGRPGPLSLVPEYLKNRAEPSRIRYVHSIQREILDETYGLMIYQEQVIQLGHRLGGLSLGEADLLRVAMSKKDRSLIHSLREKFIAGCQKNGLTPQQAGELFRQIENFAGYAFNKAHSVSYALITWRAAYLKAHFPKQFFMCLLNSAPSGDKARIYLLDAQSCGIKILPPDVRFSESCFGVEGNGLRFGLGNIKFVGNRTAEDIIAAREIKPFASLSDFVGRLRLPNQILENLIYAGAMDGLGVRRECLRIVGITVRSELQMLHKERELLGVYVSNHPVSRFGTFLKYIQDGMQYIAGEVTSLKKGQGKVYGSLESPNGLLSFVLSQREAGRTLRPGRRVALFGRETQGGFVVNSVFPLGPVLIIFPQINRLAQIHALLEQAKGDTPVVFRLNEQVMHILPAQYWVNADDTFLMALEGSGTDYQWFDPWQERI